MKAVNITRLAVNTLALVLILTLGCTQSGLTLKDARAVEVQIGERGEYKFTLENQNGILEKEYRDLRAEFVDDKWLVRTVSARIDKPVLKSGDSAVVEVVLEGAKVGVNPEAKLRLLYSDGGKEFPVRLEVKKNPGSNATFKLSSLSPLELLAFSERCTR